MNDFSQEFIEMMSAQKSDRIYAEMWRRWAFAYVLAIYTIRHA